MQLLRERERHLPLHTFDSSLIEDDASVLPAQVSKPWERGKESAVRAPEVVSHIQGAGRCQAAGRDPFLSVPVLLLFSTKHQEPHCSTVWS